MMRTVSLPNQLDAVIQTLANGFPPADLRRAVARLIKRYRSPAMTGDGPAFGSDVDVAAYMVYRFPATYAASFAVMGELALRLPSLRPTAILDVGSGPGTASLAACAQWSSLHTGAVDDSAESRAIVTLLERDAIMLGWAGTLMRAVGVAGSTLDADGLDLSAVREVPKVDIAVAAYLLCELSPPERERIVDLMWEATGSACVLVEPGTPSGFHTILEMSELLANRGAHILAPAPPTWTCLTSESDWLHFAVRVPRSSRARWAKLGHLSHEDEKYAYLIASRLSGTNYAARVVRHPQTRPGHIRLRLCSETGVTDFVVSRARKEAFGLAKRLAWGDSLDEQQLALLLAT